VFVSRARELFRVPDGYIGVTAPSQGMAMELVESEHARLLFDGPHDIERWDVRTRRNEVVQELWTHVGAPELAEGEERPGVAELFVLLTARRGDRPAEPVHAARDWRPGDGVGVAIYAPEQEEAHAVLRKLGFEPQAEPESAAEA